MPAFTTGRGSAAAHELLRHAWTDNKLLTRAEYVKAAAAVLRSAEGARLAFSPRRRREAGLGGDGEARGSFMGRKRWSTASGESEATETVAEETLKMLPWFESRGRMVAEKSEGEGNVERRWAVVKVVNVVEVF